MEADINRGNIIKIKKPATLFDNHFHIVFVSNVIFGIQLKM